MATNVVQVYHKPGDVPHVWAEISQFDADEEKGSRPFTTVRITIGDTAVTHFFLEDTGDEAQRVAYEIHYRIADEVEKIH